MPPIKVWTYWEGPMPAYIRDCLHSIRYCCQGDDCDYVHVAGPEHFQKLAGDMVHPNWRNIAEIGVKSDVIRCGLLSKFGGLWVDADTVCLKSPSLFCDGTPDRDMVYSTWTRPPTRIIGGYIYMQPGSKLAQEWLLDVNDTLKRGVWGWVMLTEKPLWELRQKYGDACRWIPRELFMPIDVDCDWQRYFEPTNVEDVVTPNTVMCGLNHSRFMHHQRRNMTLPAEHQKDSALLIHRLLCLARSKKIRIAPTLTLSQKLRDQIARTPSHRHAGLSKAAPLPRLETKTSPRLCAGIEYYRDYVTSENEQLQRGLESAGWTLTFADGRSLKDVCESYRPAMLFVADRRDFEHWDCFGNLKLPPSHTWRECDGIDPTIFKATVLKDVFWYPQWQAEKIVSMGIHAVVVYYDPEIVELAFPWLKDRLVRTWHSVEPDECQWNEAQRCRVCFSGAVDPNRAGNRNDPYPLRNRILKAIGCNELGDVEVRKHPGYSAKGCDTPGYLEWLSRFKVSICTASVYSFSLRKIIEGVANGCTVVTDLHESLPEIDDGLVRIDPGVPMAELNDVVEEAARDWDADKAMALAEKCKVFYDWRRLGKELSNNLEKRMKELR
jgi:hypothetical protein